MLLSRGDLEAAASALEKAVALDSKNANAQSNLGVAYHRAGKHSQALEHYRLALALDPDQREAEHNLQALLRRQGSTGGGAPQSVPSP